MDFPVKPKNYRYFTPEVIDVEPQALTQAQKMSENYPNEVLGWRAYVNGLGLLAFQQWLQERLPHLSIVHCPPEDLSQTFTFFSVNEFKYCLIITDQDETENKVLTFPQMLIDSPLKTAHFYIFLEVIEEAEQAVILGFIRYDQLHPALLHTPQQGYHLQKTHLDPEPNHLLLYTRYLSPDAIELPMAEKTAQITQLRGWLKGLFEDSWQTLDQLLYFSPSPVNFSFRGSYSSQSIPISSLSPIQRGKLLEFSLESQQDQMALVMGLTPTDRAILNISVEVIAVQSQTYLPEQLKLLLLDETGNTVMQAQVNQPDKSETIKLIFVGKMGDKFTVQIRLNDVSFTEVFEI